MNQIVNSKVRPLLVASQLGAELNARIAREVEGLTFIDVPPGPLDERATDAEVVFAAPTHGSVARSWTVVPKSWPGSIRWIQLISAGIDGYPRWIFNGPTVTCARGPSAQPIAEFVLATIFASARHLPELWVTNPQEWKDKKKTTRDIAGLPKGSIPTNIVGRRLAGTTLGLVGFGAIGQRIAELALALGFHVVATRRTDKPFDIEGVERAADAGEVFARADFAVLVAPATPQTDHLINHAALAKAKQGLHLINVARGSLIDDKALLEALDDGRIGLASLDVTDPEPLPEGHPFYTHPRIRLTPHISMMTDQADTELIAKFADNIARYRRGEPLRDPVDSVRGY
ncbi:D-isomer specific 2-hydroxyacid dehydrogenase family protein [Beijerinckia indica]|uniref:D-isomer specific 2-hydroxyacid dehydrogenase NAD-binding n=1 Tax=Beijerinckia indica subsp. indica (strain ATCC 9039 / DSM 1715 / NCIMB 8712) TaxID=395963 RepID=B2IEY3_BEII9|nr:D-isomer specific 2-hydroxyacid dehydrogenase family protein [Beijerinckia indica]ACB94174.1 D-isomer specific 2-hydroxyacid dehydrogenase NAD-binding [Beijerinckia indica subsp. indica ATCC 9039]